MHGRADLARAVYDRLSVSVAPALAAMAGPRDPRECRRSRPPRDPAVAERLPLAYDEPMIKLAANGFRQASRRGDSACSSKRLRVREGRSWCVKADPGFISEASHRTSLEKSSRAATSDDTFRRKWAWFEKQLLVSHFW